MLRHVMYINSKHCFYSVYSILQYISADIGLSDYTESFQQHLTTHLAVGSRNVTII